MKFKNKIIAILNEYYDLNSKRRFELENLVGDMEDVMNLSEYQKLVERREELIQVIEAIESADFPEIEI